MSKVLVDRELLPCPFCGGEARLDQRTTQSLWNSSDAVFSHVACDECDISGQDFCDDPNGEEASEWWNRRAQPAEAEGTDVPVVAYQSRETGEFYEQSYGLDRPLELVLRSDHLAALSAVTAERDRLESMLIQTTARHFALQLKDRADDKKLDECLSEGIAMLEAERDRLLDQVKVLQSDANSWQSGYDKGRHDGTKHRQSEVGQLSAEVEALRKDAERYRMFRRGMFDPDRFDADIDAMAAKEA